jgi:RimJ/RimL family protein N-acetyltransferase
VMIYWRADWGELVMARPRIELALSRMISARRRSRTDTVVAQARRLSSSASSGALAGNWEIARWVATIPHPYTEADGREWIARVQENHATGRPHRFAIALKKTDRLIGGVGLDGTTDGDRADVILAAAGHNFALLLRHKVGKVAIAVRPDAQPRRLDHHAR